MHYTGGQFFDSKKSSGQDLNHILAESVLGADSEYLKKSIGFYGSFQRSCVVFQRSSEKSAFKVFSIAVSAYEKIGYSALFPLVKTAALHLSTFSGYSKYNRWSCNLEQIVVHCKKKSGE
jgi:hypothetical protein